MKDDKKTMDDLKRLEKDEREDDVTKYGEFVSSYFAWIPLKEQKEKVQRMENITKKKD